MISSDIQIKEELQLTMFLEFASQDSSCQFSSDIQIRVESQFI